MPYRRLPNTDQARLTALQTAVQRASEADFTEQVISYHTLSEAQAFLLQFENIMRQYHENFAIRVKANKQYRHVVQNARMYISHFIQVLNLSVIRGEIKRSQKELYKLDPDTNILPDLSSEEDLLVWGKNIIEGEEARVGAGGYPIYNPAIAKVKVHYDIFKEHQFNQQIHQQSNTRVVEDLLPMREKADALILDLWNQIEAYYKKELPYARLRKCQNYGVIYYYRNGEEQLTPETDKRIQKNRDCELSIKWSELE
ncbi:MAG: hypothetical protein MJZ75_05110 [Paludibacteraceae bacterium]|nr:hypothetical protein [Paludibacteraceae bacterium]